MSRLPRFTWLAAGALIGVALAALVQPALRTNRVCRFDTAGHLLGCGSRLYYQGHLTLAGALVGAALGAAVAWVIVRRGHGRTDTPPQSQ